MMMVMVMLLLVIVMVMIWDDNVTVSLQVSKLLILTGCIIRIQLLKGEEFNTVDDELGYVRALLR
jgi:hypothetical protein